MTDLTPTFNELLKGHNAAPTADPSLTLQNLDGFLKEAYRINSHIASLNRYLKDIRQSYLSTAPPPRRTNTSAKGKQWRYLNDRQREEIDAETKKLLRELNVSIRNMEDTEGVRHTTQVAVIQKKYARSLGRLGSWAAGGAAQSKTMEQELDEARLNTIKIHRDSIVWYLRQKLQECGSLQASMMEKRIMREMEKNKSNFAKSRAVMPELRGFDDFSKPVKYQAGGEGNLEPHIETSMPDQDLSPEQLQMFEKQNQDMLKHYQTTLDQVRTAEKSLIEISELQTQLVTNLETQSAHIEQLVADSFLTTENVGGGNKELKKATQRKSTAKYVFYASCGLSAFLVLWDLVI